MHVSQINNTNFSSKQHYLDEFALQNFKNIRKKLGDGSVITTGEAFYHTKVGYLRADDVFFSNIHPTEVMLGKSLVKIDDNGLVQFIKKPFLKSKNALMEKLGTYLAIFDNLFEIDKHVEKKYLRDTGYVDEQDGKVYITKREWLDKK